MKSNIITMLNKISLPKGNKDANMTMNEVGSLWDWVRYNTSIGEIAVKTELSAYYNKKNINLYLLYFSQNKINVNSDEALDSVKRKLIIDFNDGKLKLGDYLEEKSKVRGIV